MRGSPLRNIFVGGVESRILMSWHFVVSSTQLLLVKVESLAREVPSPPRRRGHAYGWQIAAAAQPFNNNQNKHKQQPRCDSLGAQQPGALWSQPAPTLIAFNLMKILIEKRSAKNSCRSLGSLPCMVMACIRYIRTQEAVWRSAVLEASQQVRQNNLHLILCREFIWHTHLIIKSLHIRVCFGLV